MDVGISLSPECPAGPGPDVGLCPHRAPSPAPVPHPCAHPGQLLVLGLPQSPAHLGLRLQVGHLLSICSARACWLLRPWEAGRRQPPPASTGLSQHPPSTPGPPAPSRSAPWPRSRWPSQAVLHRHRKQVPPGVLAPLVWSRSPSARVPGRGPRSWRAGCQPAAPPGPHHAPPPPRTTRPQPARPHHTPTSPPQPTPPASTPHRLVEPTAGVAQEVLEHSRHPCRRRRAAPAGGLGPAGHQPGQRQPALLVLARSRSKQALGPRSGRAAERPVARKSCHALRHCPRRGARSGLVAQQRIHHHLLQVTGLGRPVEGEREPVEKGAHGGAVGDLRKSPSSWVPRACLRPRRLAHPAWDADD